MENTASGGSPREKKPGLGRTNTDTPMVEKAQRKGSTPVWRRGVEKKKSYHGGNPRIENVTSNEEREGPQRRQRRLRLTGGPGMTKGKRSKTWEEVKDLILTRGNAGYASFDGRPSR